MNQFWVKWVKRMRRKRRGGQKSCEKDQKGGHPRYAFQCSTSANPTASPSYIHLLLSPQRPARRERGVTLSCKMQRPSPTQINVSLVTPRQFTPARSLHCQAPRWRSTGRPSPPPSLVHFFAVPPSGRCVGAKRQQTYPRERFASPESSGRPSPQPMGEGAYRHCRRRGALLVSFAPWEVTQ